MRLIDADALIADCQLAQKQADRHGREFANAFYSGGGDVSTEWWCVEDMIENAPTIEQPEIIRCKDCKYYQFADNRAFGMPVKMCKWFGFEDVDDSDFCSRAERREEGGNDGCRRNSGSHQNADRCD